MPFIDIDQTETALEAIFQSLTASILSLDSNAGVRIDWQTTGAPAFGVNDDVAFIKVMQDNSPYFVTDTVYEAIPDNTAQVEQVAGHNDQVHVYWVFYGPNGFDRARLLRDQIKYQVNHDVLARCNIYLLPQAYRPDCIHEFFPSEGLWYKRADIDMVFNMLVVRNVPLTAVEVVTLSVENKTGTVASTDITGTS